ncbi:MAG TPA: prolyl oligopeptidase family serine peptidase [Usitatibacter sp.]|nr:prolyl oligopeptidase family serine peptidase [Usitatibacter sp.]
MSARRRFPWVAAAAALVACVALAAEDGDDPFRALENLAAPATQAYLRGEAARARAQLDRIPGRAQLLQRIRALSDGWVEVTHLAIEGGRVFYLKAAAAQAVPALCVREGFPGAERVLVDPQRRPDGGADASIDWFSPSPDGRHVAFGMSRDGSGDSILHVLEVDSGADLPLEIDRARLNRRLAWDPDGRSFYYTRIPEGNPPDRRDANARVYRHILGRPTSADEVVFAPGVGGARDVPEMDEPWLVVPPESRYAFAVARDGSARSIAVHVTLQKDLAAARPRWHKLVDARDGVLAIEAWRNDLYLLSRLGAPNRRVLRVSAGAADLSDARVVAPEGDAVIEAMGLARDGLYLRTMVAGVDRLERVHLGLLGAGSREYLRTPFDTAIAQIVASPLRPGAVLRLDAWLDPPRVVEVDARTGDLRDTGLQPPPAADFSSIDEVRLYAPARDGAKIPVTLLYRRSTRLTHDNPTLLVGYGAYGDIQAPRFDPARLAWLEHGGIYAVAHVRGGGEYGDAWHDAGRGPNKATTVLDFVAVCEFLERYGFTNPNRLAIEGSGAGGIPVGGTMVRRPDLVAAVVARGPLTDLLRLESTSTGRADAAEFGSPATTEERAALASVSPYRDVRDGMPYPALLVAAGLHDPQVDAWQAAKLAARVGQATSSGKPVLLSLDFRSGAQAALPRARRDEQLADIYAFVLWQLGEPGFQPEGPSPPAAPAETEPPGTRGLPVGPAAVQAPR